MATDGGHVRGRGLSESDSSTADVSLRAQTRSSRAASRSVSYGWNRIFPRQSRNFCAENCSSSGNGNCHRASACTRTAALSIAQRRAMDGNRGDVPHPFKNGVYMFTSHRYESLAPKRRRGDNRRARSEQTRSAELPRTRPWVLTARRGAGAGRESANSPAVRGGIVATRMLVVPPAPARHTNQQSTNRRQAAWARGCFARGNLLTSAAYGTVPDKRSTRI